MKQKENLFQTLGEIIKPPEVKKPSTKEVTEKLSHLSFLLEELCESQTAEKYKYLVKFEYKMHNTDFYSIYDKEEDKLIMIDKLNRIKSYFNVRNINENKIFYNIKNMVTKSTLKFYEFENIEEYFDYTIQSKINGQHKQAKEYFNRLSEEQKNDFFNYIGTLYHYEIENENREELTELQNYFNN